MKNETISKDFKKFTNSTNWGRLRFLTGDSDFTGAGGVKIDGGREGGEIEEDVAMVDKACGDVTWVVAWTGVAVMIFGGSWTGFGAVGTSPVSTFEEIWFDSWGWVGIVNSGIKDLSRCL